MYALLLILAVAATDSAGAADLDALQGTWPTAGTRQRGD